ncbi:MAG: hypothetical protein Q9186_002482 [Xanthomendoza sp. 1 TL-2023]
MARLSFSDYICSRDHAWSRLETLPPEIFLSISIHLAFFDKKALASTSHRIYSLMGPLYPPDRFSWRLHMCTSFNRCSDDYFDITIIHPDDITRELSRILDQVPKTTRKGHYFLDPLKSRLRDLNCLYFPAGFYIACGERTIRCQTIGQFVAIQFRAFVARLLLDTSDGEDTVFKRRHFDPLIDFAEEHKASLMRQAHQWRKMKDFWIQGFSTPKSDEGARSVMRIGRGPLSAAEASEKLMVRMGYEELKDRMYLNGHICEAGAAQGMKTQNPNLKRPLLLAPEHNLAHALELGGNCEALPQPAYAFGGYDQYRVRQKSAKPARLVSTNHQPSMMVSERGDPSLGQDYFDADDANVHGDDEVEIAPQVL